MRAHNNFTDKEKWCPGCEKWLSLDDFSTDNRSKSGKKSRCNKCFALYNQPYLQKWVRFKRYGVTQEQYDAMYKKQNGCCAVCGNPFEDTKKLRPEIDHDHVTGVVRGLIHGFCNIMLGAAHDDPETLRLGAKYLDLHKKLTFTPLE